MIRGYLSRIRLVDKYVANFLGRFVDVCANKFERLPGRNEGTFINKAVRAEQKKIAGPEVGAIACKSNTAKIGNDFAAVSHACSDDAAKEAVALLVSCFFGGHAGTKTGMPDIVIQIDLFYITLANDEGS